MSFEAAKLVLKNAIKNQEIPSAVAAIGNKDSYEFVFSGGLERYGGNAVDFETYYDLASLTKVVSTLPSILYLINNGELSLNDKMTKFFSNSGWFQSPSLADISVFELLTHTAGLPAWKPLFANISTRETAFANILQTELKDTRGDIIYSDLGFMLLGIIVERISKMRQDEFVSKYIFAPLDMKSISYGPVLNKAVAATEDCGWRNRLLVGEVHDENAYLCDGIAGHAGLFGRVEDLAKYAMAWLNFDARIASPELMQEATNTQIKNKTLRRGLGWLKKSENSFASELATQDGYGHTGFSGVSVWLEPTQNYFIVLLTNRIHPTRNHGKNIHKIRQDFHAAIMKEFSNN